jgi:putative ABC transport system permease protein
MFKTNPGRTWLTILGMGVGTSAVVMLVGLGFGLQGILLEQIVSGDTLLSLNVANPPAKTVVLTQEAVDSMSKMPNVDDVSPMASFPALMTIGDLTGNLTIQGVQPNYFRYTGVQADKGILFKDSDAVSDKDKIILSKAALKLFQLDKPEDVLGKKVKLRVFVENPDTKELHEVPLQKEYTVKAVTTDAAAISAFLLMGELSSNFAIPFYERVQVKVKDTGSLTGAQTEIIRRGFQVTALSKTVDQANKIFTGVQVVLATFGGIALVVSAIGMFNTMTVTLLERTGEIGIMRTIGASPRDIKILFLSESVVVGFLGGVVGIIIGCGGGLSLNLIMNLVASRFGGTAVSLFRFPLLFLTFIAAFSGFVGFLTGVFPATRASNLNPLDAIRYK